MTLEVVFAREGLEAICFGARMPFSVFLVCFLVSLHVFRVSESMLTHRTTIGVHLDFVMGFSVVPATLSVNSHRRNSCSAHLRPDRDEKILSQGKHTWRPVTSAMLDGPTLTSSDEGLSSLDAVDLDGFWKLGTLGCVDWTELVVDVVAGPSLRVVSACGACCELCVAGDRYCLPLEDHTLGGGDEVGALSTPCPMYDPSSDSWPFEKSSHWLMPLVELCACCASKRSSTPSPGLAYPCVRPVASNVKVGKTDGACLYVS